MSSRGAMKSKSEQISVWHSWFSAKEVQVKLHSISKATTKPAYYQTYWIKNSLNKNLYGKVK